MLTGRLVVVSPHLDDAVLSLGATMASAARNGAHVTVLTVFACDPQSSAPAEWWDRAGGFRTLGEAACARREEDRRACAGVGATTAWLPFNDASYGEERDEDLIWDALTAAVEGADGVLLPGYPLAHVDHAWLHAVAMRRGLSTRIGLYVEQPYAWRKGGQPDGGHAWNRLRGSRADRRAKGAAIRAYGSQLPLFGRQPQRRLAFYELLHRGERFAWI